MTSALGDQAQPAGSAGRSARVAATPRRSLLASAVRFCLTGVLSVGVDVGVLWALHSGLGVRLAWSTLVGYLCGLVVNYTLNRNWTFQAAADHRETLSRYAMLVGFNVASTLVIVLGLTHLGLYYLLSKLIAIALNAGVNFLAGRHWVFRR